MELFGYDDPGGTEPAVAGGGGDPLQDFAAEDWDVVREFAAERRYAAGAAIRAAGDAPAIGIVLEGDVRISFAAGGESLVGASGVFGVAQFFDAGLPGGTAVTAGGAMLLLLTPDGVTKMAAWRPRTALLLLTALGRLLSRRLHETGRSV